MIINGTDGDDDLTGTPDDDQIFAGGGNDTVHAGGGNNSVAGGDGDDTLVGGNLNDRLAGGAGNDSLDGGGAFNAAVYDLSASTTSVDFTGTLAAGGAASTQADGLGGVDTLVNIQALEIYGGSAADHLTGSAAQDLIEGGAGNDVLAGRGDRDTFAFDTARRDLGIDTITDLDRGDRITLRNFVFSTAPTAGDGTSAARGEVQFGAWDAASNSTQVFVGADDVAGADLTIALTGRFTAADFSRGTVFGGAPSSDLIYNGAPAQQGTSGPDTLTGGNGNDTLIGGAGNDTLFGGAGDDTLYGGTGNDRLFGGAGNDFLDGGVSPGEIVGNQIPDPGLNAAVYDFSAFTTAVVFPDWPIGFNPNKTDTNTLPDGLGGTDTLANISQLEVYGGSAADTLSGYKYNALLEGNGGDDLIDALRGADTVAFDTARRDLGTDRIGGFGFQDRILLRNFQFTSALGTGDGTGVLKGEVQFGAYDATQFQTRVFVGTDDVAGADLSFILAGDPYTTAQFSRNTAGTDAYLVMDNGASEPRPPQDQTLQGTTGNDNIDGGAGNDTIHGGDGSDILRGLAGDDLLFGDGGNDHLNGGAGNDLLDGGTLFNAAVYDFSQSTTAVDFVGTVDPAAAQSTQADGLGGTDTVRNVQSLEVYGGSAADHLTGGTTQDLIEGRGGDDVLAGGGGNDVFAFDTQAAPGALGVDRITDISGGDRIELRGFTYNLDVAIANGDGTTVGRGEVQIGAFDAASNTTRVFVGTDAAAGADLTILLDGQFDASRFGRSTVSGTPDNSFLNVNDPPPPPADPDRTLTGTAAADTLTGGSGNDTIRGAAGNDILDGAAGSDTIHGDAGNDKLFGGDGDDHVFGDLGKDRLEGGAGSDTLVGGDADDMLWGDDGADWLQGDAGNDRLTGGAGDDFLVGGGGSDILIGNAGADTFWFQDGSGTDQIQFFFVSHHDRIRIDANVNGSGIRTAADAYAHTTDTADGALVDLGAGNSVLLVGVHADAISAAVFDVV